MYMYVGAFAGSAAHPGGEGRAAGAGGAPLDHYDNYYIIKLLIYTIVIANLCLIHDGDHY